MPFYNDAIIYVNPRSPRFPYDNLNPGQQAGSCVECFECEAKGPRGLPITEQLKQAHELLSEPRKS